MKHDTPDHGPLARIGPGEDPTDLLAEARAEARRQDESERIGAQVARRLIVAFVLIVLTALVCFVVFPMWNLDLPPWVPLGAFVVIMVSAVLTAAAESPARPGRRGPDDGCSDDACAVGMCPGPRPMRSLRDQD